MFINKKEFLEIRQMEALVWWSLMNGFFWYAYSTHEIYRVSGCSLNKVPYFPQRKMIFLDANATNWFREIVKADFFIKIQLLSLRSLSSQWNNRSNKRTFSEDKFRNPEQCDTQSEVLVPVRGQKYRETNKRYDDDDVKWNKETRNEIFSPSLPPGKIEFSGREINEIRTAYRDERRK